MDFSIFEQMDGAQLRGYIRFLLWHYRVMNAFWFIHVSEQFDQPTAERLNKKVWGQISGRGARDLVRRFHLTGKGMEGFVTALRYFPWSILVGYEIEERGDEVILTVPSCPTQASRLKGGLKEYNCKEMHRRAFEGFTRVIDDRIRVACVFTPRPASEGSFLPMAVLHGAGGDA